ncbi:hypothetical protein HJC03_23640 [Rhizobium sp. NLR4b]|uniref:hypothetical protein n=1 Tax=Rhizobium sp. NLR4b TaxID=2731118 RepID=UPI001C82EBEC|nr:hypothetical protein [Rhizobium sp. NLR4b]MBX5253366.1 hypothetical protein [Rhizobium sp. NLR4b]
MTSLAFDFVASSSPSQVYAKRVPLPVSKRQETVANRLESLSSNDNLPDASQGDAGKTEFGVSSPQAMLRELGELIAGRQPAKVLYPLIATDLRHYSPDISLRRVRAIFNGEASRLWDDEAMAIRMALSQRRNAKARRDFARAAAEMAKQLAENGIPLSADQHRVVQAMAAEVAA